MAVVKGIAMALHVAKLRYLFSSVLFTPGAGYQSAIKFLSLTCYKSVEYTLSEPHAVTPA